MFISCLFVFLEVCSVTPTYRKSWAKNLLIWSDFTLGFSFKVKRCYNGFGEFSSGGYNLHRFSDALGLVFHGEDVYHIIDNHQMDHLHL